MPPDHPFARLGESLPGSPERPEIWLLGSSPQSAEWAVQLDLPYAFADFINPDGVEITRLYRERANNPYVAIGVWAIAADTDQEAERLGSSIAMSFAMLRQGRPIPSERVRSGSEQGAEVCRADEVNVVTNTHDHQARRRSYELIAEAFELAPAARRAA